MTFKNPVFKPCPLSQFHFLAGISNFPFLSAVPLMFLSHLAVPRLFAIPDMQISCQNRFTWPWDGGAGDARPVPWQWGAEQGSFSACDRDAAFPKLSGITFCHRKGEIWEYLSDTNWDLSEKNLSSDHT